MLERYYQKKKKKKSVERSAKASKIKSGGISCGCDLKNQSAYICQEEDCKVT